MSSSTPSHKFLLEENVHRKLYQFLKTHSFDVKLAPKSSSDKQIANISKIEGRMLVTNDEDFIEYSKDKVFSVVWLRIAQNDIEALIVSFKELLEKYRTFSGRLIILKEKGWDDFKLGKEF